MVQPYSVSSPWESVDKGYQLVNNLRTDQARARAGNALRGGDYNAAAGELFGAGEIETGANIQGEGRRLRQAETQAQDAKRKQALEFTMQTAGRLRQLYDTTPDPTQKAARVLSGFDQLSPRFRELGDSEEEIAQTRRQLEADPEATLTLLGAGSAKELGFDIRNAGDEVLVLRKSDGKLVARYRGGRTLNIPEGGALYELPGTGGEEAPPASPQPAPQPAQPPRPDRSSVPSGPTSSGSSPRSVRNNNPGNIEDGPFARSLPGYKGSDGRFAIFDSPEAGAGAQSRLLQSYGSRGINTVQAIINRWAPPSDNNPTRRYVDFVSRKLGVSPRTALDMNDPEVIGAIQAAIAEFEGGQPFQVAAAGATPPPPSGGPRLLIERPKEREQWVDLPGGGQRNTLTGKTEGVPKTSGRLSATVIKLQDDLLRDLGAASSVNTLIDKFATQLDSGELNLGPLSNVGASIRNFAGKSDVGSRNYTSFRAALEKMRNDSLRLNKGVQTEGDAQRAWNELLANVNDEGVVVQRLAEIKALNEQAIALRSDLVNQARQDSGFAPMDTNRFRAKPLPSGGGGLPEAAKAQLKEGEITTFQNGQRWTLRGGKPQRVN